MGRVVPGGMEHDHAPGALNRVEQVDPRDYPIANPSYRRLEGLAQDGPQPVGTAREADGADRLSGQDEGNLGIRGQRAGERGCRRG